MKLTRARSSVGANCQYILGLHPPRGSRSARSMAESTEHAEIAEGFVPDLCRPRTVLVVVLLAELLVFMLVASAHGFGPDAQLALALLSLYVQMLTLSATAALCSVRRVLAQQSLGRAMAGAWLLVMGVIACIAEAAWQVVTPLDHERALIDTAHGEFLARTLVIAGIAAALILRYFLVTHLWRRQILAESRARLQALQARIRPHFLFNCMNTIASLTRSDPATAERVVEDLSDLFRASLRDAGEWGTFGEEAALARRYLDIEAVRLGPRLAVDWDLGDIPVDIPFPRFILQPLLENALFHGIEPLPEGGRIVVEGRVLQTTIRLEIRNPLRVGPARSGGHGLALDNVRQRLSACYPGQTAVLETRAEPDLFRCQITFPRRPERT